MCRLLYFTLLHLFFSKNKSCLYSRNDDYNTSTSYIFKILTERTYIHIVQTKECMQCLFPEQHLDIKLQKGSAVLLFICSHGKKIVFFLTGARATSWKKKEEGVAFLEQQTLDFDLRKLKPTQSLASKRVLGVPIENHRTPKLNGPVQSCKGLQRSHFKFTVTSEPVPNLIPNRTSWIMQLIHSPIQRAINISDLNATQFPDILIIFKPLLRQLSMPP